MFKREMLGVYDLWATVSAVWDTCATGGATSKYIYSNTVMAADIGVLYIRMR